MMEGFRYGDISIRQFYVLADNSHLDLLGRVVDLIDHLFPIGHIGWAVVHVEFLQGNLVEAFTLHHERHFVNRGGRAVFDNGFRLHVAEHGNLFLHVLGNGLFRAAYEDIRLNTDGTQFLYAVLGRLGLEFAGSGDIRQQRYMDVERILRANFFLDLTDGFEERLAFDITYRTADFRDDHIGTVSLGYIVDTLFDFVGDMRDNLHRGA